MVRIQGDRALVADGVDRLGFQPTAERLAEALAVGTSPEGLVVGVTGRWGSGKSSLLNLAQAALQRRDPSERPHVVEFKPWLVGDRDALLQSLFGELVAGIDKIELEAGDATSSTIRKAERAGTALREFVGLLSGAGKVVKAAGAYVPGLGPVGTIIEKVADALSKGRSPSLAKAKKKVCDRLRALRRTLVVVIDDVDRLEPGEIVEVLRLVRSVADFPNVTYVLSYDIEIVAHAVRVAAKVGDGHAYIEKIVQITLPVPIPEAFDLRRWFELELWEAKLTCTIDEERRIGEIIDREGGRYLTSPRAVVRTLDSIRFYWAALEGEVDLSDFIWLQFVKVGNPALHEWIALYLTEMSARASGRVHVLDEQIAQARTRLDESLAREATTFDNVCGRLSEYLPGIVPFQREGERGIYEGVDADDLDHAIQGRRLSSPDHYRLYFAFAQPTNTPTIREFTALNEALTVSAERGSALLLEWQSQRLTSGVSRAEVVLDRLSAQGPIDLQPGQAENLLVAYSNVMDELGAGSVNDFGGPDVWRRAKRSLPALLTAVADRRPEALRRMFGSGAALGWLSSIFRDETFAHGRFGDRPETVQLLSSAELDLVTAELLVRYQGMSFADFAALPQPLNTLYAWQQGGDEQGPRRLLAAAAKTDDGLIDVLENLGGMSRMSTATETRERITLSRSNVAPLVDYDDARARIANLVLSSPDHDLRRRAGLLHKQFEDGERF